VKIYFHPEHSKLLSKIGLDVIKDLEHYRIPAEEFDQMEDLIHGYVHLAALCMKTGDVYIGGAACSVRDQYNRKRGYGVAVGRALKRALVKPFGDAVVPLEVVGLGLRDACRQVIVEMDDNGILHKAFGSIKDFTRV